MTEIPSEKMFLEGCVAFQKHEKRDAMYKVADFLINHFWGQPAEMADGLGVLLLTWNQAYYRYGPFDYQALEECIKDTMPILENFRSRDIYSYTANDDEAIDILFKCFMVSLQISEGKKKGSWSPVSAAKALHLLAPRFFPLWDKEIADAYNCDYSHKPSDKYLNFIKKIKGIAEALREQQNEYSTSKSLVKLIDEYNYARYTKGWI